jgi:hypothetical protein
MPSRESTAARTRPVGPPPTTSTGVWMVCVIAKTPRGCPSVAHRDYPLTWHLSKYILIIKQS